MNVFGLVERKDPIIYLHTSTSTSLSVETSALPRMQTELSDFPCFSSPRRLSVYVDAHKYASLCIHRSFHVYTYLCIFIYIYIRIYTSIQQRLSTMARLQRLHLTCDLVLACRCADLSKKYMRVYGPFFLVTLTLWRILLSSIHQRLSKNFENASKC